MFKIVPDPTFLHDVDVTVPVDGDYETQKLGVRFRVLQADELVMWDLRDPEQQKQFCEKIVVRFTDLTDQDGQRVECTEAIKAALIGTTYVRSAIMAHYTQAISGAQRKN